MSNRQANDQSRNRTKSGLRVHANVEVRYCKVGRSGSLIFFIPLGKVHFVDTSARRICPNGIGPLRGYIPKGALGLVFIFSQKNTPNLSNLCLYNFYRDDLECLTVIHYFVSTHATLIRFSILDLAQWIASLQILEIFCPY